MPTSRRHINKRTRCSDHGYQIYQEAHAVLLPHTRVEVTFMIKYHEENGQKGLQSRCYKYPYEEQPDGPHTFPLEHIRHLIITIQSHGRSNVLSRKYTSEEVTPISRAWHELMTSAAMRSVQVKCAWLSSWPPLPRRIENSLVQFFGTFETRSMIRFDPRLDVSDRDRFSRDTLAKFRGKCHTCYCTDHC